MTKLVITKNKKIILAAMLLAILLVLSRFLSVKTTLLVISFSFIPIMISAIYLGPKYTALIAALGDLIGAILFPFGPYFFRIYSICRVNGIYLWNIFVQRS